MRTSICKKSLSLLVLPVLLAGSLLGAGCQKNIPPAETAAPPAAAPSPTPPPPPPAEKPPEPVAATDAAAAPGAASGTLDPAQNTAQAPKAFKAEFKTSKGIFVVEVTREWAPLGADRFFNLVKNGYFDKARFFRVVSNFMVQWGIHGDPAINTVWREARFNDDPPKQSNQRGFITFATAGPNSRTTQLFINFKDNAFLDGMGFAPFGKVSKGMDVVDKLYPGYGEGAPQGRGPNQMLAQSQGNAYLERDFPQLDYIESARILK